MSDVKNQIVCVLQERIEEALKDAAREMRGTIESTVDDAISTAISGVADEVADSLKGEIVDMVGSIDFEDVLRDINVGAPQAPQSNVIDFNVNDLVREASMNPAKNFALFPASKTGNITTWEDFFLFMDAVTKTNVDVTTMLHNLTTAQAVIRELERAMRDKHGTTNTIEGLFQNWSGR